MNPEIKSRWIEALRSGEYEQTKSNLSDGLGYCCLGVLCEIAIEDDVVSKFIYSDGSVMYGSAYELDGHLLPGPVSVWGDVNHNPSVPRSVAAEILDRYDIEISISSVTVPLSWLNDHGVPFHVIAEMIEEAL
jgi:hypothetical protein